MINPLVNLGRFAREVLGVAGFLESSWFARGGTKFEDVVIPVAPLRNFSMKIQLKFLLL
jgi:hypothetical protein